MKNIVSTSRFSLMFAFLVFFLLQHNSAHADYTIGEAWRQLNRATAQLAVNPGGTLPRANCVSADRFLDQADVTIDQILRERTQRGCIEGALNDLEQLAIALSNLGRTLQRRCGMRRSYDNTLVKVRSWRSTRPCGSQTKQQQCQQYSNTAVAANQININKNCGYTGSRWSNNYTGHYNWCLGVSQNAAHQETEARKILIDNCAVAGACNHFIGLWKWFNGFIVHIFGNYTFSTSGNNGTWRCLPNGKIEMRWKNGGWVDTLSISPDGHSLTGRNQHGGAVGATRQQTQEVKAMLYDIQQGAYGGGRFCLTAKEAKRIKNDPNTVKFTPLGISCKK